MRNGGTLSPGSLPMALAKRVSVPKKSPVLHALERLIAMHRLPPSDLAHKQDEHGRNQAAADRLVPGDLPSDPEKKRHQRTGTSAAAKSFLQLRLVPEVQSSR